MTPDQKQMLIETNARLAYFTLTNRLRISINPADVRSVIETPNATEISLTMFPVDHCHAVSDSYEDVLQELNRASM